ncbi:MAG TPA: hypothetical protein VLH86_04225, partial [Patescibacteria group bacterium]|nr:hypothetical protein [Patescibacteria group bacterium]
MDQRKQFGAGYVRPGGAVKHPVSDFRVTPSSLAPAAAVQVSPASVYVAVTPVNASKLTPKQLWQGRPRSFSELRRGTKALVRVLVRKSLSAASRLRVLGVGSARMGWQMLRHPKLTLRRIIHTWIPAFAGMTKRGARMTWWVVVHPRRSLAIASRAVRTNFKPIATSAASLVLIMGSSVFLSHYFTRFNVAPGALGLLPKTSVEVKLIQTKNGTVNYHAASDSSVKNKVVLADPTDATDGHNLYEASLSKDPGKGLTFSQATTANNQSTPSIPNVPGLPSGAGQSDPNAKLSFSLTPLGGGVQHGRVVDGRLQYPSDGGQRFYTFRKNGIAEDILLTKAPGNTAQYQWRLDLPSSLEARMMGNGSVGIYSANAGLFGNVQVGDQKSQALLDKARKNGQKDTLAFVLPAPFIKSMDGRTNYQDAKFGLKGNILTLTATNLQKQTYPLSIDPSTVVVTSTSDFRTGFDDGMIDYTTTANQITRSGISGGATGTWNYTAGSASCATFTGTCSSATFTTTRGIHASIAYNGYLYIIGGYNGSFFNDVQYAPINSNGTIGTWNYTAGSASCATFTGTCSSGTFTGARWGHSSVVYNGYLYVIGGSGVSTFDDVQYAPINANGTIGTWASTTSFTTARVAQTSVVYDGYLYIIGGSTFASTTSCAVGSASTWYCNDVQYAPINANGTIGSWNTTTTFTTARAYHTSVVYNGYLYISGGTNGSYLNDVQYAQIQPMGTLGKFIQQSSAFTTTRNNHASVIYNGYLYIVGGNSSGTALQDVSYCPINSDGSVGTCTQQTTAFPNPRYSEAFVAYNGFLYLAGGSGSATFSDVVYSSMSSSGALVCPSGTTCTTGVFTQVASALPAVRTSGAGFAYNGFFYVAGGAAAGVSINDVLRSQINANGSLSCPSGFTCSGSSVFTQQTTAFANARVQLAASVYNGYVYISGGRDTAAGSTYYNDIQYSQFNSNGTLACPTGATCTGGNVFAAAQTFTTARQQPTTVASSGYLYIIGGDNGSVLNDIQYCPLASNGTVGTCSTLVSPMAGSRTGARAALYGGNIYISGGLGTGTSCVSSYCNDVQRFWLAQMGQATSPWQSTSSFTTARFNHTSVAYNGYLYVIGGLSGISATGCTTGAGSAWYCSDVQYAPINSDGTLGTWATTTSFAPARSGHTSIAYNGYLYIVGGLTNASATGCTSGSASTWYCNDVQYALICTGSNNGVGGCGSTAGTVGTWNSTTSFATARYIHASVAYNGYLYIMGGLHATSDTACNGTAHVDCSDVQYALICTGSNNGVGGCGSTAGTVGTWNSTTSFATARNGPSSVAYNGYLYVIGGYDGSNLRSDVQYALICTGSNNGVGGCGSTAGTVGTWNVTNGFGTARTQSVSIAYNGYLYVIGGNGTNSSNDCNSSGFCSGVQYAPINVNGTIGSWDMTTSFATGRNGHTAVIYNGYLYVTGGKHTNSADTACNAVSSIYCSDVQYNALVNSVQSGHYERTVDTGSGSALIQSIVYNGTTACGAQLQYAAADS